MVTSQPVLDIRNLSVSFSRSGHEIPAVRGIDLAVAPGTIHALVGESGSGKTVTSTCVMGLLPETAVVTGGPLLFEGRDLLALREQERRALRGKRMAMVFQEPGRYLNPAFRVGEQIGEMLRLHRGLDGGTVREETLAVLETVGLGRDRRILRRFPHELSGGMKQRVMIAMAVCCRPALIIADEPTTALDMTLQRQIMRLLYRLCRSLSIGILFISHDLSLVRNSADQVSVIYAGRIAERGSRQALFAAPRHPYTQLLLAAVPDRRKRGQSLQTVQGRVPSPEELPGGCPFHPRCPLAEERCRLEDPDFRSFGEGHEAACFKAEPHG